MHWLSLRNNLCTTSTVVTGFWLLVALGQPAAAAETVVKIGLSNVMNEPGSDASIPHGDFFRRGVILAFEQYKAEFIKRNLKVEFEDFNYSSGGIDAQRAATEAVKSKVVAVIGYNYSDHVFLAEPIHTRAKLALITPYGTANRISQLSPQVFQVPFNNSYQGQILAKVISQRSKEKKIAIIVAKDCSYCTDLAKSFRVSLGDLDTKVVEFPILSDQTDFSKIITALKKQAKEIAAILIPNTELLSVTVINKLANAGFNVPYFGGDGWSDYGYRLFKDSIKVPVEAYSVTHWDQKVDNVHAREFLKKFQDRWGTMPFASAALAFDAGTFVAKAMSTCPELTREAMSSCLASIQKVAGAMEDFVPATKNRAANRGAVIMKLEHRTGFVLDRYLPEASL